VIGRGADDQMVRLGDVAEVRLGAENERNAARANGVDAVSLGIEQMSKSNLLEVSDGVRAEIDRVANDLPGDMRVEVNFDQGEFVRASMRGVVKALVFALVLVLVVIFGFLGTLRATLVPAVVVPVSIVASFTVMAAFGYTLNELTLLGLVLAIGLVVDDSIVVLETIFRRIERGQPALLAALEGSRQIAFAVIATTLVLVAVFVPLSFIEGDMGRLFGEFGISLAAAVIFSSVVALSLTPMMCSKLFADYSDRRPFSAWIDARFKALSASYERALSRVVARAGLALGGAAAITLLAATLFLALPSEYAPLQDRGAFPMFMRGPEGASFAYTDRNAREVERILASEVEDGPLMRFLTRIPASFGSTGDVNTARFIILLDPWGERDETLAETTSRLRSKLASLPGVQVVIMTPSGLGVRGDGRPVEIVLGGADYAQLEQLRDLLLAEMREMPELVAPRSNYQVRKPQLGVSVDRDRAATLGVSLATVGRTLETMLGSRRVTTYIDRGREYDVILQGEAGDRASPDDLTNLYVRSETTGNLVALSNLVVLDERATAQELHRFDRMRSVTLDAALAEGVSLGEALDALKKRARAVLPGSTRIDWDGESREFLESQGSLAFTFGLALLIVFLVLAAQFESFVHPAIILVTVPLALTGALLGLAGTAGTINVYSQIGAILLIGLSAKNGVLVVEFANQLRDQGRGLRDAVVEAASVRLRPILMTSACTTFGALPLLLASGAGAESRQPIGVVIVFGVTFSAALTLFVVPAFYTVLAGRTRSPDHVTREINLLRDGEAT
jgi:multidrug efflux pump